MKKAYSLLPILLIVLSFSAKAQLDAETEQPILTDHLLASNEVHLDSDHDLLTMNTLDEYPMSEEALEEGAGTQEFYREVFANVTEPPVYIEADYPVVAAGMEDLALAAEAGGSKDSVLTESNDSLQNVETEMRVIESAACKGIENHRPVESDSHFSSLIRRIWVYSRVELPKGESGKISHVYFRNGKKIQTVELAVKGPTFRTRSYKSINQLMDGDWKVEIRSPKGTLLDTVEFEVYAECP